jgi:hypothetical protein
MPKLWGYRERIDATVYDAFSPKEMLNVSATRNPEIRIFGNRNIGNAVLTNLQQGGQLAGDQTYVITTWYARTNVSDVCIRTGGSRPTDLIRAWDAWVNATTVNLVVGTMPIMTRPLVELMGPRMFGSACGNSARSDDVEALAEKMWANYRKRQHGPVDPMTFGDVTELERQIWISAASVYPFTHPVIIPVRQCFSVTLESDRNALTMLLKVLPENVAPRPLVWVHLDGVLGRFVA